MDIYENIIVGNFLFGLGMRLGVVHSTEGVKPISASLLQQTPLDTPLADVVLRSDTLFRIIEFKRASNKSNKEHDKWLALKRSLQTPQLRELESFSRKIHWYVVSDFRDEFRTMTAVPYLDFPEIASPHIKRLTFQEFIETTAANAMSQLPSENETELGSKYLHHLAKNHKGVSGGTGCLVVNVDKGGQLLFAAVESIMELLITPRQSFHKLELERVRELKQQQSREYDIEREY